jgi:prepilin-type N-terminal cleavage/methylation domain-containing protein
MRRLSKIQQCGFSLLEMMVALALGSIVLGAAVGLYSKALTATWTVSQRTELQQDFRAASNLLTKDLSMAGAGLGNSVQIALPSGPGTQIPVYGCDQTPTCYVNGGAVAYPTQGAVPYLYGLIPGWRFGPTLNAAAGPTDIVTVVNSDTNFLLNCYNATINAAGTAVTFLEVTFPQRPSNCVIPLPLLQPQAINDPAVGLTPGDLVMFQVAVGGLTSSLIGEVTNVAVVSNAPRTYTVAFAAGDPLRMNQPTAAAGSLGNAKNATGFANRIFVNTYYIDNTINPPRLMRQVSGHSPVPVAEGVAFLQFSYDLYDFLSGQILTNQPDGGAASGMTPRQITKANILHMSMRSTLQGAKGYQGLDLSTSVSTRDLTFNNRYPPVAP